MQVSLSQRATIDLSDGYSDLPEWHTLHEVAEVYLMYCDSQPLPLFHRATFRSSIRDRDKELVLALLALTIRFTIVTDAVGISKEQRTAEYSEASRKIISSRVYDGTVELSTVQSLCLLSIVDFTRKPSPGIWSLMF